MSFFSVTITYNPNFNLLEKQLSAIPRSNLAIIIDNGSTPTHTEKLRKLASLSQNIELKCLDTNMGIAHAQNRGIEMGMTLSPESKYILLLDHDTIPTPGHIEKLTSLAEKMELKHSKIAAVGPRLIDPRTRKEYGFHKFRPFWIGKIRRGAEFRSFIECDQLNSSGTLIPIKTWKTVGEFREDFFIDHVETEWCFRARSKKLKFFGSFESIFLHEMGDSNCTYWFFGKRVMPYRSPLRHYYLMRNSIFLQKMPTTPFLWKGLNVVKLLLTYIYFGFFSTENKNHRKYMKQGIIAGFKNAKGPIK